MAPDRMSMVIRCDATPEAEVCPLIVRLTWRASGPALFEGDRIAASSEITGPTGALNPGGFDYAAYLERQGIDAVATVNGLEAVEVLESGGENVRTGRSGINSTDGGPPFVARLQSLSQPALGLFLGVIIGERGYLESEVRDQFMVTGTVHLLSISGSHLGLVAMITFMAVKRGCCCFRPSGFWHCPVGSRQRGSLLSRLSRR